MDLQRLMELCMCPAPQGDETAVKELLRSWLPEGLQVSEDAAGSLVVRKEGEKPGLMLFASLSQPTVLVTGKKADGSWKLQPLGAGKVENLGGKTMSDGKGAWALLEEKDGKLKAAKENALAIGTLLTPQVSWRQEADRAVCKNMEDKVGCWLLAELLQKLPEVRREITVVFLAQEALNTKSAEIASNNADAAVALRIGSAPVENLDLTGVPVKAGNGPALKLRERYVGTDGRLRDILRNTAAEKGIPFQYELLELSVTGLYTAQYGHRGVVVSGIDIPVDSEGAAVLKDLQAAEALLCALVENCDDIVELLETTRPAVRGL